MRPQKSDYIFILIGRIIIFVMALGMTFVGGYFSTILLSAVYEEVIKKKNILFLANPFGFTNLLLGIVAALFTILIITYILDSITNIKTSSSTKSKTANLNTDHTLRDRTIKNRFKGII